MSNKRRRDFSESLLEEQVIIHSLSERSLKGASSNILMITAISEWKYLSVFKRRLRSKVIELVEERLMKLQRVVEEKDKEVVMR